jgi:hypothetical protein
MPQESPARKEQAAMTVSDASTGREHTGSDVDPNRQPVARGRRAALSRAAAFWLVAGVLFLLFFAAAAPSPLYGVYQAHWQFSAITLTAVFAAYALLLLVTLLVFGSVSDYLSLGPLLAGQVLRSPDLLWGGLVIFLLNGIGATATVVVRRVSGPAAMLAGCLALLAGTAVTLAAIETTSAAAFLAGTAVAGAGFGTAMLGAFRTISVRAAPGQRAGLIAAYFIASYTAFSIPS